MDKYNLYLYFIGVFMYSFSLYDNLQDAALSKEAVRLKAHWRYDTERSHFTITTIKSTWLL